MLLHCRRTQARALALPAPADRDALLRLMPATPPPEATVAIGQTTWTPPTTPNTTADPTSSTGPSSPKITKSGPPSTSLVRPTRLRSSRKYSQAARRLGPSSTRRDPTTPCLLPTALESMLTTGSATVMYAVCTSFFLFSAILYIFCIFRIVNKLMKRQKQNKRTVLYVCPKPDKDE